MCSFTRRNLAKLSFVFWFVLLVMSITILCYCPGFGIAMGVCAIVPLIVGPSRWHRIAAIVCLLLAVAQFDYHRNGLAHQQERNALIAQFRAQASTRAFAAPATENSLSH